MLSSMKLDWENRFFKSAPILPNFKGRGGIGSRIVSDVFGGEILLFSPLVKKAPMLCRWVIISGGKHCGDTKYPNF